MSHYFNKTSPIQDVNSDQTSLVIATLSGQSTNISTNLSQHSIKNCNNDSGHINRTIYKKSQFNPALLKRKHNSKVSVAILGNFFVLFYGLFLIPLFYLYSFIKRNILVVVVRICLLPEFSTDVCCLSFY